MTTKKVELTKRKTHTREEGWAHVKSRRKLEPLTTRIPTNLGTRLRVYRAKHRISIQHLVTKALEEYLAKGKKRPESQK